MPGKARHYLVCAAALLALAATAALAGGDEAVSRNGQDPAPPMTGRVVDSEGKPIPGVKIWTEPTEEERRQGGEPQPRAITGPDGTFVFRENRPFPLLAACPTGWAYERVRLLQVRPPYQSIELRLQPATRISGRVVDKSGEPVAGLHVRAELEGMGGGCIISGAIPPCENSYEPRYEVTDAEGRFTFESLKPGWWEISASDEDERQVLRRRGAAGRGIEGVNFVLAQNSVPVEGRVVDADGVPVAGASVTLSRALPSPETETDAEGTFRFSGILSGESHLTVEHPDQGWIEQDVEIGDRPLRLDLQMRPVTLVQGRILGPDNTPVKQVFLQTGEQHLEVAADGTFRLAVPPGDHEIIGRSYEPRSITRERFTARGEPIDLELRLARPGTIQARLTGLPPGEKGWIDLQDRPNGLLSFGSEKDFSQIDGVPPGAWTLVASDANGRTLERPVQIGEGETVTVEDIHFPPLPSVRGRVLDPAGQPAAGTEVIFVQEDREIAAETNAEGTFVTWLREGVWTVRAEHEGFGLAVATAEVPGDAPLELPDLRLVRLVAVSGRVLSADPEMVIPWVMAQDESGLAKSTSQVGEDNRFHLPYLWPGTWTLSTDLDGRVVNTTLQIPAGATEVRFDLDLGRTADGTGEKQ